MFFPWNKYDELPISRRNTLQIFITSKCNLICEGCFVRKISNTGHMSLDEYKSILIEAEQINVKQINIIGGEPLLHPDIETFIYKTYIRGFKITVYTNGVFLPNLKSVYPENVVKFRVSLYSLNGLSKSVNSLPENIHNPFDANFMVSRTTTVEELIDSANRVEDQYKCKVFFISSLRELDNDEQEFFKDTDMTMPVLEYKKLVHEFLRQYNGNMEIHVSKRGVFESTLTLPDNKCRFANYFQGGKIIQCPYDIVNEKYQDGYSFGTRNCQHNNTCLMSKVVYKRK